MMSLQTVLLVPGLYPRGCEALQRSIYQSIVPVWRTDGYRVVVCQFGWNNQRSLADRQSMLLETIDALPGKLYAIGASAGGLAVINAHRIRPRKFHKVITVASPLSLAEADLAHFKDNPFVPLPKFLRQIYVEADNFLNAADKTSLASIVSLYGRHDPRVLPQWSQRPGIASYELPARGHAKTIMAALRQHRQQTQRLLGS